MERASDKHNRVRNAGFSGSQYVCANARAFDTGDGVFHDDSFTCQAFVEWPVSRLSPVWPPFGCSHRSVRLRVARKATITEDGRTVREPPFLEIDAVLVVPSTRLGFAQKNNPPVPDGEDVLDGVALFAAAVTGFACHAVLWPAARAVSAIDDECQGGNFSKRFFEIVSLSFGQAKFALERRFEDGRQAVRPLAGLGLAHPEEERHHVERGIAFKPEQDEKEFFSRGAQNAVSAAAERASALAACS